MAGCSGCGGELEPGWKFCIRCGARIQVLEPTRESVPEPAPEPGPAVEARESPMRTALLIGGGLVVVAGAIWLMAAMVLRAIG
ncbi:hypothetical protein [Homoserinibacter sp. YIM 151385]|uniref:hypothetical protein n=1 Tax=Homoserinibacter sp. YIM 151385 TaxID=2985506 RepID=UPI0022F0BA42|nr:hypothetical protein [Homoserinibacter sp. YIM 151385]WBU37738.1 hypothetical protein OF852_12590 [Homoserinibacter sp. YIM 151385]